MKIKLWHIYFVPNCAFTKPIKDKYVIPVCIYNKKIMGFLINSEITNYVRNRPELLDCEAPLKAFDHSALKHDSIVDCHTIFPFNDWDFQGERGEVSPDAKKQILRAVKLCPSLENKYKKLILLEDDSADESNQ
jgi:hypothetical protein